jgi:ferredoxin
VLAFGVGCRELNDWAEIAAVLHGSIDAGDTWGMQQVIAIQSCTHCGDCERRCPYGLPIMDMLHDRSLR